MRGSFFLLLIFTLAITSACSPSEEEIATRTAAAWTATLVPTTTPTRTTTPTNTLTPTNTPKPTITLTITPSNTVTITPTITTAPISEGVSTYSDVLNTYPEGVRLCITKANLDAIDTSGNWRMSGSIEIINDKPQIKCYGTKITVNISAKIEGRIYEPETKLTVDENLDWFIVSSWD